MGHSSVSDHCRVAAEFIFCLSESPSSSAALAFISFFLFFSLALSTFSRALFCQVSAEVNVAAAEQEAAPAEPRAEASPNLGRQRDIETVSLNE